MKASRLTDKEVVLFAPKRIAVESASDPLDMIAASLFNEGYTHVVIDLSSCKVIDSRGVGEIVSIVAHSRNRGGSVALNRVPEPYFKMFEMCCMLDLFEITDLDYSNLSTSDITADDVSGLRR